VGFPIWWKTTSVYRASLPFDDILRWDIKNQSNAQLSSGLQAVRVGGAGLWQSQELTWDHTLEDEPHHSTLLSVTRPCRKLAGSRFGVFADVFTS
jgi:hypothetical protein